MFRNVLGIAPILGIYSGYSIIGGILATIVIDLYKNKNGNNRIMKNVFLVLIIAGIMVFSVGFTFTIMYGIATSSLPYLGGFMEVFSGPFAFAGFAWIAAVCWFSMQKCFWARKTTQ